tara:strand:- start:2831 stop:4036 length:1206 start_codon:yes stop_codon:yes gene_type:complete
MKILILDTNRRDIASLIYHYCKLGHEVFYIKPFSTDLLEWKETVLWPVLLTWSTENPDLTNFYYHGYNELEELPYGEDNFLYLEDFVEPLVDKSIKIKLVDIEKENNFFDAVHLTPGKNDKQLKVFLEIIEKYCQGAKIINSTFDPHHFLAEVGAPGHTQAHNKFERFKLSSNSCEFLPAIYEGYSKKIGIKNYVPFFRHPHEIELLGVDINIEKDNWRDKREFASFMHNFKARHSDLASSFDEVTKSAKDNLDCHVENYGSNIRGTSDLRYSGKKGLTGNYVTLSPRGAIKKFFDCRGIVHFKSDDWAGGVEVHGRSTNSPLIIPEQYFYNTKMESTYGKFAHAGSVIGVNTVEEVGLALEYLLNDKNCESTKNVVSLINQSIFTNDYWDKWKNFLERLE